MTNEQLNKKGYYIQNGEIIESSYKSYLQEFGQDLTTSPRGVEDRLHVREIKDDEGNTIEWQIWSWGTGGNRPRYTGYSFATEEEAELHYYERSEWYVTEKNWDAPRFHNTKDDAIADFAEGVGKPVEVVERYFALKAITDRKEKERRAEITSRNDERKAWLAVEVPKEAESLVIDEEFKQAIQWAGEATGNEKSNRMSSALKGLLQRNGRKEIKTDFWQVLRLLKAKAEK